MLTLLHRHFFKPYLGFNSIFCLFSYLSKPASHCRVHLFSASTRRRRGQGVSTFAQPSTTQIGRKRPGNRVNSTWRIVPSIIPTLNRLRRQRTRFSKPAIPDTTPLIASKLFGATGPLRCENAASRLFKEFLNDWRLPKLLQDQSSYFFKLWCSRLHLSATFTSDC